MKLYCLNSLRDRVLTTYSAVDAVRSLKIRMISLLVVAGIKQSGQTCL
jgi:hypothetical protein